MSLAPGTKLGPYEVLGPVGAGGMGEVYRARDPRLGREVAVKVLPDSVAGRPEARLRFEREARAVAKLSHPNVLAIFDVGEADGVFYAVTELLKGQTPRERLASGPVPVREAVSLAIDAAQGLAAAHEAGIVHRDVKPENLFVTEEGRVKVLDFGLARREPEGGAETGLPTLDLATAPGAILGTMGYMAPEQVRGQPADARSDVFGLGCVLYEMLVRRRAFEGLTPADTLSAILQEEPDALAEDAGEVPPGFRRLLASCLAKRPEHRFQSARDLALALEVLAHARSDPPSAKAALPAPASVPASRKRRLWAAGAAGLALGAAATAVVLKMANRPVPRAPFVLQPLTATGPDRTPAAAADGSLVAFVSARDGKDRIWLKRLSTGDEVPLTEGPSDAHPLFTPDGSSVLFTSGSPVSVFRVPVTGGQPRRLLSEAALQDVSPDGAELLVNRGEFSTATAAVASADGGEARPLAGVPPGRHEMRFSADGRRIAVAIPGGAAGPGKVLVVSRDGEGSSRELLPPPGFRLSSNALFGNGDRSVLAFYGTEFGDVGSSALVIHDVETGAAEVAWVLPLGVRAFSRLPDGRLVVSASLQRSWLELELAGGGHVQTLTTGTVIDWLPFFSAGGERLLFSSNRSGNFDIWEITLASGSVKRLVDDPASDLSPAYLPDGRIVFSSARTGSPEIFVAQADGSGAVQVTHDAAAESPAPTADGWIVYRSGNASRPGLFRIRPDGREAAQITAGEALRPAVSPDGRLVAFAQRPRPETVASVVRVASVADGDLLPLRIVTGDWTRATFLPDGRLAFRDLDEVGEAGIFVVRIGADGREAKGSRRRFASFGRDPQSWAVSPDGQRVVVAHSQAELVLWLAGGSGLSR